MFDEFPTTPGAFDTTYNGGGDAFVTKLDASGAALGYSTYLGGRQRRRLRAIAVDGAGNAYVTGYTYSTNFPTTPGAFDTTHNGGVDAFVTKLTRAAPPSPTPPSWAEAATTRLRGSDIAVDGAGSAYVTGDTGSPTSRRRRRIRHDLQRRHRRLRDEAGGERRGPRLLHLPGRKRRRCDYGNGVAVDGGGNAYVTGDTRSANFPTTPGAFDTTYNGGVRRLRDQADATARPSPTPAYLGGSGYDYGNGIAVDGAGNAYVTGYTYSTDFPTTAGAFDTTYNGDRDAFVTKLNAGGAALPTPPSWAEAATTLATALPWTAAATPT